MIPTMSSPSAPTETILTGIGVAPGIAHGHVHLIDRRRDKHPKYRVEHDGAGRLGAALAIELGSPTTNEIGVTAKSVDGTVTIEVRDTGCGIPEDYRERVFEPFFTTREVGNGKGLGLSVCAGIVASARGRIDVASVVGVGTTMRVVLPTD